MAGAAAKAARAACAAEGGCRRGGSGGTGGRAGGAIRAAAAASADRPDAAGCAARAGHGIRAVVRDGAAVRQRARDEDPEAGRLQRHAVVDRQVGEVAVPRQRVDVRDRRACAGDRRGAVERDRSVRAVSELGKS